MHRYVGLEVHLVGTFHQVSKGEVYIDTGFAKLPSGDESFYREVNGGLEPILLPGERVEVVARLRYDPGAREALEDYEKKEPKQEVPSTRVETIGGKKFMVWPQRFFIVELKVVPLRYPLTDAEVQMVQERLAVAPENPERLVPEDAPVIGGFGTFDCVEGDEWYSASDTWTKLNQNWALCITEEHRKAGLRHIGEVMPISEMPEIDRLRVTPAGAGGAPSIAADH